MAYGWRHNRGEMIILWVFAFLPAIPKLEFKTPFLINFWVIHDLWWSRCSIPSAEYSDNWRLPSWVQQRGHMQLLGSHERSGKMHALHGAEQEDTQLQLWMVLWDKIRLVRGTVCNIESYFATCLAKSFPHLVNFYMFPLSLRKFLVEKLKIVIER